MENFYFDFILWCFFSYFFFTFLLGVLRFVFDKWSFLCVGTMNCNSFRLWASLFSFFNTVFCFIWTFFFLLFSLPFLCCVLLCVLFSSIPSSAYNFFFLLLYSSFALFYFIRFRVVPCSLQLVRLLAKTRYTTEKYTHYRTSNDIFIHRRINNIDCNGCSRWGQRVFISLFRRISCWLHTADEIQNWKEKRNAEMRRRSSQPQWIFVRLITRIDACSLSLFYSLATHALLGKRSSLCFLVSQFWIVSLTKIP